MAVCGLRTLLLIVCVIEMSMPKYVGNWAWAISASVYYKNLVLFFTVTKLVTVQRQVFDFLGYMWLPIIANFINILLIIFGSFGAVQYITKYLLSYAIWSLMWLTWNVFLICYYLNIGTLNRESGLLSLGTGSVSWWESNGWGCLPVWGEIDGPGTWRPVRVDGCFLQWQHVELAQSAVAALLTTCALPLAVLLAVRSLQKRKPESEKGTLPRRPVYTIELSQAETNISESSMKPMTPRRVKRRSGSRGNNSSVRRSRRSYRNAGYLASNASLPRDPRASRPTSAHSSYSNFHAARPASYHAPERDTLTRSQDVYDPPPPTESVPIMTNRYDTVRRPNKPISYDVAGPYNNEPRYDTSKNNNNYESTANTNIPYESTSRYEGSVNYDARAVSPCESPYSAGYGALHHVGYGESGWEAPPPPAPPYSARATPQAPGPPAYQPASDGY